MALSDCSKLWYTNFILVGTHWNLCQIWFQVIFWNVFVLCFIVWNAHTCVRVRIHTFHKEDEHKRVCIHYFVRITFYIYCSNIASISDWDSALAEQCEQRKWIGKPEKKNTTRSTLNKYVDDIFLSDAYVSNNMTLYDYIHLKVLPFTILRNPFPFVTKTFVELPI